MDYKELIKKVRMVEAGLLEDNAQKCATVCHDAATAIETLLEERDALMKDVVRCDTCIHAKECYFNELRRADCTQSNRGHWKWRGPAKGDTQ